MPNIMFDLTHEGAMLAMRGTTPEQYTDWRSRFEAATAHIDLHAAWKAFAETSKAMPGVALDPAYPPPDWPDAIHERLVLTDWRGEEPLPYAAVYNTK